MTNRDRQLIEAMDAAIELLRTNGAHDSSQVLLRLRNDYLAEPTPSTRCAIRRLFGGALTLNDLVLCRDRVPLIEENDALDRLKSSIYELAQEYPSYE